jgi:uroporphyrinogen decarboxylase
MTSRQRLATVLAGELPDCVPAAPDISNMVPARLTGKPFWQLYLFNDPPIWEAYIAAARHFDIDALMDGYCPLSFPEEIPADAASWVPYIVDRSPERLVVRRAQQDGRTLRWVPTCQVYYRADPPTSGLPPAKLGLPETPERYEPIEGWRPIDTGPTNFARVKRLLGDQGLIGAGLTHSSVLNSETSIYDYYDNSEKYEALAERRVADVESRFARILALPAEARPDFLCVGGSGTLVYQTVDIFRRIALPAVRRGIELATAAGIPTHVHSCGPERELVRIMAEETTLTVIDPLEIPPMGDCVLADLKRQFGHRLVLKGNLHTTEVMLRGTANDVRRAARQAIDAAAEGGRFILSTGDQCGRDTPDANLRALVETARSYGVYPLRRGG